MGFRVWSLGRGMARGLGASRQEMPKVSMFFMYSKA